jgi:MarR family transcriptional regulator, organic hydroperoxide resistance regulator
MSTVPQTDATVEAAQAWSRFLASLRRARARLAQDPEARLTLPQYLLISPLLDEPGRTVGALAAAAGVASPTATRMLDGLERDGIVLREASEHDRRAVALRLTPAGARVARAERARLEAKRAALFEALEPKERAQAARLLDRLADVLEDV